MRARGVRADLASADGEDEDRVIGAGGFTFSPRGSAHAFTVTSPTCRVLAIQTPGSGEAFYRGASVPADESGRGPVDFEAIKAAAVSTGATTIVGPPPFAPAGSR